MESLQFLGIGLIAGLFSGVFGIGGGLVIVPALIFLVKFPAHQAIGTSLCSLLLPVGLFGVIEYYRAGNINIRAGLLIALGLFLSTWIGAKMVQSASPLLLRRLYGVFLMLAAFRMLINR